MASDYTENAVLTFRVLGPLEIMSEGSPHSVQGSFQAILLLALLLRRDRFTSAEELMDEMWGQGHPHKPENALQAHVSRLRRWLRAVEPGRPESRLTSQGSGYRLLYEAGDEFDAATFEQVVTGLRPETGRPARAAADRAARLRSALGMWRGPVLGGITGGPICQRGVKHFEEIRLAAYEMLFDAELERGDHAAVISEISELAGLESAFQERFCEQQVIALCRSGRHADALDVCRGPWYRLVAAGGGSFRALRYYEHAILRHDPILNTPQARMAGWLDSGPGGIAPRNGRQGAVSGTANTGVKLAPRV
ncbi:AfsR/SARP family transcriptional regulator [Streptosporangiaceae bacterium NEAU-GS5]|nr:AfsR/SARP family transcriptional regulator [Streptosporangiaceae bacterium NEAU-GS5]